MSCRRFAGMNITSVAMMFILMYLNTYLFSHLFWSETLTQPPDPGQGLVESVHVSFL